jgi:hypothetical protein
MLVVTIQLLLLIRLPRLLLRLLQFLPRLLLLLPLLRRTPGLVDGTLKPPPAGEIRLSKERLDGPPYPFSLFFKSIRSWCLAAFSCLGSGFALVVFPLAIGLPTMDPMEGLAGGQG